MDSYDKHIKQTQTILDEKFRQGKIKKLYIGEILEGLSEVKTFPERVKALQANSERSLNTLLLYAFKKGQHKITDDIISRLEYNPGSEDEDIAAYHGNLQEVATRLYIFNRDDVQEAKMKRILEDMLENLHPYEAEILLGVFKGKLPVKNITRKLVETAFPDLFEGEEVEDTQDPTKKGGKSQDSGKESEQKSKKPETTEGDKE